MNMHKRSYNKYMSVSRQLHSSRDSPASPWYNDQIGKVAPISNSTQRTSRSGTPGSAQGTSIILPLNFSASASKTSRSLTSGIAERCASRWRFCTPSEKFLPWLSVQPAPGRALTFFIQLTPPLSADDRELSTFYLPELSGRRAQLYPPGPLHLRWRPGFIGPSLIGTRPTNGLALQGGG